MDVMDTPPPDELRRAADYLVDQDGPSDPVYVWLMALADGAPVADDVAAALAVTLALAQNEPPLTYGASPEPWCALCGVDARGSAATIPQDQHAPSCPWRQARELERRMAAR